MQIFGPICGSSWAFKEPFSCRWNLSTKPFAAGWCAVVRMRVVPKSLVNSATSRVSNLRPRSLVIVSGAPNTAIHPSTKALGIVSAAMSAIGIASGHVVFRSTEVSKYMLPYEGSNGPTRSMCTCENRASGVLKVPKKKRSDSALCNAYDWVRQSVNGVEHGSPMILWNERTCETV